MMSSSALQPSALQTSANTATAATPSPTTITTTTTTAEATATLAAVSALAQSIAAAGAPPGSAVPSAVFNPTKNPAILAILSPSHCIQSPTCYNTNSSILSTSVAETTTSGRVATENVFELSPLSRASSESSDLKWQSQQQSETIYVNPLTGTSTSISGCGGLGQSEGVLLVPSAVCWEQRGQGVPPQKLLAGAEDQSGTAPLHVKACADPRPPVLGEEQRTGQEEDSTTEQEMFMQGDGWGECPAVVGSGEEGSPVECSSGGNGGGSLELSSGSSSHSSSNPVEWAMSLDRLLADPAGVAIFIHFLKEESGCSHSLDFFFACKGLGKQSPDHLHQLLPLIWKKFIRNYNVPISSKTHAVLAEKIHGNSLSSDMFRVAQKEVYDEMKDTTYPAFLQSQAYLDQLQQYHQEQHKQLGGRMDEQHRGYQSTHLMQTPTMDIGYSKKLMSVVSESPYSSLTGGYTDKTEFFFSEQPHTGISSAAGGWTQSHFGVSGRVGALSTVHENEISVPTLSDPSSNFCRPRPCTTDLSSDINRLSRGKDELSENNVTALGDVHLGLCGSSKKRLNLTSGALAATVGHRAVPLSKAGSAQVTALNPYHAKYARGHHPSRHDSEGQSISSGAHTDDTRSYTDSSLDGTNGGRGGLGGGSTSSMKQQKKQRLQMKENLRLNEELRHKHPQASLLSPRVPLEAAFVPRTQRGESPSSNLARHPEQFASLLTQKLEAVQRDRETHERIQQAFRMIQENEGSADVYRREHAVNSLPPSLLINKIIQKIRLDDEDCGQAILDQHVSRVWQESSGESSAYSPSPPPHPHHYYSHLTTNQCLGGPYLTVNNPENTACVAAANTVSGAALNRHAKTLSLPVSNVGGKPITNKNFLQQQQQFVLQQQQRSRGVLEGAFPSGAPNTPMINTPHQMSTSKSWHQTRHREHKGPDVYSTFSSDSGNVADYCDAGHRNARRHHGPGMPKARSVPEHIMDNCAGSGSERYLSSSGGSRGRGPSLTADLTDSGVSVISGSRPSLLTPSSNSSSVKQRVETWLADSTESSHKLSSSCSSIRGTADLQPVPAQADRSMQPHSRRGASIASSCVSNKLHQQQYVVPGGGSAQDPTRRRHRGNGAGGDLSGRAPMLSATVVGTATMMTGAPGHGGVAALGSTSETTVLTTGSNGGDSTPSATTGCNGGPINNTTGCSGGNSDRNTSSSNGSTMRKQPRSSAKHGGGGSDSQSSCGRSSDSTTAESTTVVYSFCDDSVPFVIKIPARSITLRRFKHHLPKRGNYRFFFKKHCEEFNGVIQEEMTEDDEVLPLYEGKIFAQIRKAD